MTSRPSVSCVLPVFNEEESIAAAVANVRSALDRHTSNSEIIVVNDGSTDCSRVRLDEMATAGQLCVLHSTENRGYGWALRTGFAAATRPLVFFTDSDNQFDAMDLGLLLPLIDEADIVIGRRVGRRDGTLRAALSGGYNLLVRALLNVQVRDVNCAFKLIRRESIDLLALASAGYTINAEMIARAVRARLRVREVPVTHSPRRAGRSKVGITDMPWALAELMSLRRALGTTQAPAQLTAARPLERKRVG